MNSEIPSEKKWKGSQSGNKSANMAIIIVIILIVIYIVALILLWDAYFKDHLFSVVYSLIILAIVIVRIIKMVLGRFLARLNGIYVLYRKKKYPITKGMLVMHPKVKITSLAEIEGLATHQDFITFLDLSYNNLTTLAGLEYLTHLETLNVSNNAITSLATVPDLPALKSLNLSHNNIRQMEPMVPLIRLENLFLSENYIQEIRGLEHLPSLKSINLSKNFIQNLGGLENCPQLIGIQLPQNQISVIENLETLYSLRAIYLTRNKITQITGLERLLNLKYFGYQHNPIPKGLPRPHSPRGQSWVKYCQLATGPAILQDLITMKSEIKEQFGHLQIVPQIQQVVPIEDHFHYVPLKDPQKEQFRKLLAAIEKRLAWLTRRFARTSYNQAHYRIPPEVRPPFSLQAFLRSLIARIKLNLKRPLYKVILVAFLAVGDFWLFYLLMFLVSLMNPESIGGGSFRFFSLMSLVLLILLWTLQHRKKKRN